MSPRARASHGRAASPSPASCGTQLALGLGQVPTPLTWPPGQDCPAPASYPHSPLARGHKISLEAQVPGINVVDPTETVTATEREWMRTDLCTATLRRREPGSSPPPQRPWDPGAWRGAVLALGACHSIARRLRAAPRGREHTKTPEPFCQLVSAWGHAGAPLPSSAQGPHPSPCPPCLRPRMVAPGDTWEVRPDPSSRAGPQAQSGHRNGPGTHEA